MTMRTIIAPVICACIPFLSRTELHAQPSPPDITFTLADSDQVLRPFTRAHRVEACGREMPGNDGDRRTPGTPFNYVLEPRPLYADTVTEWSAYRLSDRWCRDLHLHIIAGADTMRLDLPDEPEERWKLIGHIMQRSDFRESPEIIRFRPGRFAFAEVIADPSVVVMAQHIADRMWKERRQEAHGPLTERTPSPVVPPPPPAPTPPLMTPERFDSIAATWGSLEKAEPERPTYHLDSTVFVRITGTITLDGGCASGMPFFAIEQLVNGAWTERVPMMDEQMDCGMPRATWTDRRVGLPLGWWTRVHQPEGRKELLPGTYRLVFKGGNLKEVRTKAFVLERSAR